MKRTLALLSIAALLLLGACGSDDGNGSATPAEDDQTTTGGDAGAGGSASGGKGGSEATGTLEVVTKDFAFSPSSLTAEPGGKITVVLTNEDSAEHTFTIEELDVEAEAHGGETAQDTFTAPAGTYEFFCEYHPDDMRGTLNVGQGGDTGGGDDDAGGGETSDNPNY